MNITTLVDYSKKCKYGDHEFRQLLTENPVNSFPVFPTEKFTTLEMLSLWSSHVHHASAIVSELILHQLGINQINSDGYKRMCNDLINTSFVIDGLQKELSKGGW